MKEWEILWGQTISFQECNFWKQAILARKEDQHFQVKPREQVVKWRVDDVVRVKEVKELQVKALDESLEQTLPSAQAPLFYWEEATSTGRRLAK